MANSNSNNPVPVELPGLEVMRPNLTRVTTPTLTIYYSYNTPVAFWSPATGLVVHENVWSQTTGRHLNLIEPDKSGRVTAEQFRTLLGRAYNG